MTAKPTFTARWACPHCQTVHQRSTFQQHLADSGADLIVLSSQQPVCPNCKNIVDSELVSSGYYDIDKSNREDSSSSQFFEEHPFLGFSMLLGGITWGIASIWVSFPANFMLGIVVGCFLGLLTANRMREKAKRAAEENQARTAKALLQANQRVEAEKARRSALPKLSRTDQDLVERLINAYPGYLPRREGVVRDIGRELNARGGNDLMLAVHTAIADQMGGTAARELEYAWDGIGEWQS
jgi:uncharacterized membrane-anchored protein YhcB (DUF1043 family)